MTVDRVGANGIVPTAGFANARFARDLRSPPINLTIVNFGVMVESLASRVNAIDPYDIYRHPKTQCAIVNLLKLNPYQKSSARRFVQRYSKP